MPCVFLVSRRSLLAGAFACLGSAALARSEDAAQEKAGNAAPISQRDPLKITRLETFLVKPPWLFLKVHTNAGIVGLGEPILEGRALTCAQAVKEIEPYLIGKDPRHVVHHWQVTLGEGYLKKPLVLREGYLDVPAGPGLGIELAEEALAGKTGHDWKNRELYDAADGSVVDW